MYRLFILQIMLITKNYSICLMVEGIIGFSDMLSIAQTIGLVGTMVLTLIFSKKNTYRVYQPTNKLEFSMT
jgi:hypothetical protein